MQAESLEILEKAKVAPDQARAIVRAIEVEIAGARDTLAEPLQDARAQRMCQRFGDPGFRGFPRRSVPAITGWG